MSTPLLPPAAAPAACIDRPADPALRAAPRRSWALASVVLALGLGACGGGADADSGGTTSATARHDVEAAAAERVQAQAATSTIDAHRLASQATFGATPEIVSAIRRDGAAKWIADQMALPASRYRLGGGDGVHKNTSQTGFCDLPANRSDTCWRDHYSTQPLVWDFYRNAVDGDDQLRQRVAYALQQIVVVSGVQLSGTYGFRRYYNALLDNAFGNYRTVLKKVTLSPLMGDYLNSVNNDANAPNENFARELLQLFTIGTCRLNSDGTLRQGKCLATYDNDMVRNYAYALTGWTYPAGGATAWGCWPQGANCQYYGGDMVPWTGGHNKRARTLLNGVTLASGHSAEDALDTVLSGLIRHPNTAPFIAKQLIQHLVTSNPSPAYVGRVASVFRAGDFTSGGQHFGSGRRGDLAATVAAILLDEEARDSSPPTDFGRLREPVLMMTATLRTLNGRTDGDAFGWYWGDRLRQVMFRPPTVFNFYPPNFPLPSNASLVGPEFAIHNANAALDRLNFLTYLLMWGGSNADSSVPNAVGTKVDLSRWETYADDAADLVDRLSVRAIGRKLPSATRTDVVTAVAAYTQANNGSTWRTERVKQAAFLILATPAFQIQR